MRQKGELTVCNQEDRQLVLAPAGAPITMVYRKGSYQLCLGATSWTEEQLGLRFEVGCGLGMW